MTYEVVPFDLLNENKITGIITSLPTTEDGAPSDVDKINTYVADFVYSNNMTIPILMFMKALRKENQEIARDDNVELYTFANTLYPNNSDNSQEFLERHARNMFSLALGLMTPRGTVYNRAPMIDSRGNFFVGNYNNHDVDSIVRAKVFLEDPYLDFRIPTDYLKYLRNVKTPDEILNGTVLSWLAYGVLWDAVHFDNFRNETNINMGTLKDYIINDLATKGLGYISVYRDPNKVRRGRPPKIFVANDFGKKLVEVCDNLGLEFPDRVRKLARKMQRSPLADKKHLDAKREAQEYVKLGLPIPPELENRLKPKRNKKSKEDLEIIEYLNLINKMKKMHGEEDNIQYPKWGNSRIESENVNTVEIKLDNVNTNELVVDNNETKLEQTETSTTKIASASEDQLIEFRSVCQQALSTGVDSKEVNAIKKTLAISEYTTDDVQHAISSIKLLITNMLIKIEKQTEIEIQREIEKQKEIDNSSNLKDENDSGIVQGYPEDVYDAPQQVYPAELDATELTQAVRVGDQEVILEKWGPPQHVEEDDLSWLTDRQKES